MAHQSLGRVFCVTGVHASDRNKVATSSTGSYKSAHSVGQSDTESNTSGYLSSSSFESSGEERRLVLNEKKVFRIWDKWGERVRAPSGPKSSTPKQGSEAAVLRKRANVSQDSSKRLLAFKKNLTGSANEEIVLEDSFWDIPTPRVHKSSSEGDIRVNRISSENSSLKPKHIDFSKQHDAGSEIDFSRERNGPKSQEWKRRPFLTQSTSYQDLRVTSQNSNTGNNGNGDDCTNYNALPRYRVKVDGDSNLVTQICKSCADFADEGKPVDESMTEFLANVDKQNLASFLNFYDRMTNSTAYERARRNPKNYEAVYY